MAVRSVIAGVCEAAASRGNSYKAEEKPTEQD